MLAQHPKTGKPIRILRSDASLWRSQKTVVWLQDQDPTVSWERWDTLVIGLPTYLKWKQNKTRVDYLVLPDTDEETIKWFSSMNPLDFRMLFISRDLVFKIGEAKFREMKIQNIICLEEIVKLYPFIGSLWDGTKEDLVLQIVALMRSSRIAGLQQNDYTRLSYFQSVGIDVQFETGVPRKLWYFTQYYVPDKGRRRKEIQKCLEMNVANPLIDKIVLLNEKELLSSTPFAKEKVQEVILGKRLTYEAILKWIYENVPEDVLCVFGNADIWLDNQMWKDIWTAKTEDVFIALLRWDVQEDRSPSKLFGPRNDSQDTWCVLSTSVKNKTWNWPSLNIPFGKAGCDNAITVEMLRQKFLIVNPALSLKTHHYHTSDVRTYDPADVVDKPVFMYVDPNGIHDMEPIFDIKKYESGTLQFDGFSRQLQSSNPKGLETFCKMLERGERFKWAAKSKNTFAPQSIPLYKYENAFQTPQGLVYSYNKLFIGKEEASKEAWAHSQLSSITPAFSVERTFAVPWREEEVKTQEGYALHYLSKILMMRNQFGNGEFWAPAKGMLSVLELFNWGQRELPVIPHSDGAQIWCKEVIQYPWTTVQEVHREEIQALRKALKVGWEPKKTGEKWVVMIDGTHITNEMVRGWEETYSDKEWAVLFEGRTSADRCVEKLKGAAGFIFFGGSKMVSRWGFSWSLPEDATVIEIQNEMDPNGEAAHLAGASNLRYLFASVPRAADKALHELISKAVAQTLNSLNIINSASSVPTLHMPRGSLTGFFAHPGDSFREMALLWAKRGYVTRVEDPTAVQIWLGDVGEVLLYDRPTMDWLFASPQEEQTWKLALFGNPKPSSSGGPSKSWFFWPRRPALVEDLVSKGVPLQSMNREKTCVFYGKIENKVQEKRRTTYDWSTLCDEFVMVNGESTPYKLSHQEYLERLANAKFGLCLAGFGKKCHREVECMAMGCIPAITRDVDMDNYANPPKEGIHYIKGETPEELKEKMNAVSHEEWVKMSLACQQWWKENASVEGSWNITKKLISLDEVEAP
jgi:hypothetical protein